MRTVEQAVRDLVEERESAGQATRQKAAIQVDPGQMAAWNELARMPASRPAVWSGV